MGVADKIPDLDGLLARLNEDRRLGRLPVPELPAVALRVRRAVEDPDLGLGDVARIIQLDPALTARVLQVANSARFGGLAPVGTCAAAVARLGLTSVRDLVLALTLKTTFHTGSAFAAQRLKDLWRHSVRVAALAQVLGGMGPNLDPERALLAGLVHDIGELTLLAYADEFPSVFADDVLRERLLLRLRPQLGALVLKNWGFDDDLARAAKDAQCWERDPRPMPDYADVVVLAHVFVGFGAGAGVPPLASLPAFNKFPLGALGPEGAVEVLEEAQEQVRAVMKMLE